MALYMQKYLHSFVSQNKKFSIFLFYYSIFSSSVLGVIINLFKLDFANAFRFFGRFVGSFFMYSTGMKLIKFYVQKIN